MACLKLFLLLALLALATPASAEHNVVMLTDDDFDLKTREGIWMVDIFAPWQVDRVRCGSWRCE
jgi:uncharacterized protein (DUF2141 family)